MPTTEDFAAAKAAARASSGPAVNYSRFDHALEGHRDSLLRVDDLAVKRLLMLQSGARAFLTIAGDTGTALLLPTDVALSLVTTALNAQTTAAATLGATLNARTSGLPA